MKMETQELDELMRGANGVQGDVRDALYEAVGVRPTQSMCAVSARCTKWRQTTGIRQRCQVELRQVSGRGQLTNINDDEQK
jgi:hypothetical protein